MNRIWENMVRTAIAGTERSPVPETDLMRLGIAATEDASQVALSALAATCLLRKAATPLPATPPLQILPCPVDDRPICRPAAVQALKNMLRHGIFPEVLPEFFQLLTRSGKRLPPEVLPLVLDHHPAPSAVMDALGPLAPWLAEQNPAWSDNAKTTEADWDTGLFAERQHLLRETRRKAPLVAIAWVEKTWDKEPAKHRVAFLEALRPGLSMADETLLERAITDKNTAVRYLAARLLSLLPESGFRSQMAALFDKKAVWSGFNPADPLFPVLTRMLPEDGLFSKIWLTACCGAVPEVSPDAGAPANILIRLMPVEMLEPLLGSAPGVYLQTLKNNPDAANGLIAAITDRIAWERDPVWMRAAVHAFETEPAHPVWFSNPMHGLLSALPNPVWESVVVPLAEYPGLLERPDSALVKNLLESHFAWPATLVRALVTHPIRADAPRNWDPPRHLRQMLQRAACQCRPAELFSIPAPEGEWPFSWQSELVYLRKVLQFRRQLGELLNNPPE